MNKKKTRNSGGGGLSARDRPGSSGPLPRASAVPVAPGPNNNNNIKVSSPASSEMAAGSVNSENDEGAYGNKRLLHACTSLIGTTVLVDTDDGHQYEGVFRVFSSKLEISLDQAHEVDPKDPSRINPEKVEKTMVFPMSAIVKCVATDVDLSYAKDGFLTDAAIGSQQSAGPRGGANNGEMRELEQWVPDADDYETVGGGARGRRVGGGLSLDDGANGWEAEDMFKANEEKYGVQTTFKDNLEGYTVQLSNQDRNSEEYRQLEAKAAEKARQIEGHTPNNRYIELENGDEEEAFSAVHRGDSRGGEHEGGSKYLPPQKRQTGPGSRGPGGGGPQTPRGGHMQQHQGSADRGMNRRSDYGGQGASPHSGRDHGSYHDDYGRGGGGPHRDRRSYGKENDGRGNPNQGGPPGGRGGLGGRPEKSRDEQTNEFKNFQKDFNLQPGNDQQQPQHPAHQRGGYYQKGSPKPPQASPPIHGTGSARGSPHVGAGGPGDSKKGTPTSGPGGERRSKSPPTASIIHRQDSSDQSQPSTNSRTTPTIPAEATPSPHGSKSGTPVTTVSANSNISGSTTPSVSAATPTSAGASSINVKKSTLNPNAKEFTLNPNAKVFTPVSATRPAVARTPPNRPMTPATPTGGGLHQNPVAAGAMAAAVSMGYPVHHHPHQQLHPGLQVMPAHANILQQQAIAAAQAQGAGSPAAAAAAASILVGGGSPHGGPPAGAHGAQFNPPPSTTHQPPHLQMTPQQHGQQPRFRNMTPASTPGGTPGHRMGENVLAVSGAPLLTAPHPAAVAGQPHQNFIALQQMQQFQQQQQQQAAAVAGHQQQLVRLPPAHSGAVPDSSVPAGATGASGPSSLPANPAAAAGWHPAGQPPPQMPPPPVVSATSSVAQPPPIPSTPPTSSAAGGPPPQQQNAPPPGGNSQGTPAPSPGPHYGYQNYLAAGGPPQQYPGAAAYPAGGVVMVGPNGQIIPPQGQMPGVMQYPTQGIPGQQSSPHIMVPTLNLVAGGQPPQGVPGGVQQVPPQQGGPPQNQPPPPGPPSGQPPPQQ